MILSGKEIVKHMGKEIVIEPFDPKRVNPNSYNLSLYNELMVYNDRTGYGKAEFSIGYQDARRRVCAAAEYALSGQNQ